MAKKKPIWKMKRFWGIVTTILGIVIRAVVPSSGDTIDQISPILLPIINAIDPDTMAISADVIMGAGGLIAAEGFRQAANRKKTNRPIK